MKMLIRDQYRPEKATFKDADYKNFYLTGIPLQSMRISIARIKKSIWSVGFQRQSQKYFARDKDGLVSQSIYTMGLGHSVAFVDFITPNGLPSSLPVGNVKLLWPDPSQFRTSDVPTLRQNEVRAMAMRIDPNRESAGDIYGAEFRHRLVNVDASRRAPAGGR
jgi:hypothetical protein